MYKLLSTPTVVLQPGLMETEEMETETEKELEMEMGMEMGKGRRNPPLGGYGR